jgi:predicted amidohydrolase
MPDITRRGLLGAATAMAGLTAATPAANAQQNKEKKHMRADDSYYAIALQTDCLSVNGAKDRAEAREMMAKSTTRIAGELRAACIFVRQYTGGDVGLVVLPEYFLTSFPGRETLSGWADKAAIRIDGPEMDALAKIAVDNQVHLAGNAYEDDPNFPGIYFQTSFLIDDSGKLVLRYRRLNSMFAPTPHDVWSKYLDLYGYEAVFPVAKTKVGNIAAIASEEILYPEIARCLALRGAEVFVHCSSEIGSPMATPKAIARRARAFENLAYVVSANTAGILGTPMGAESADGNSQVLDYKGNILAESNTGSTFTAFGEIDLGALRRTRRKPGMTNLLARSRLELFAPTYANTVIHPANGMLGKDGAMQIPEREYFLRTQQQVIERMIKAGII